MKRFAAAFVAAFLAAAPAVAQNVFFPANPGDMIVKGATTWGPVPGGTAGCVLMSNGPTAAPTWSCALPLNFSLPPMATNTVWGNVSGGQAPASQINVNQFLNTVGYDTLRPPSFGSMLVLEPTTATWQALVPSPNVGWVLASAGPLKVPVWAAAPVAPAAGFNTYVQYNCAGALCGNDSLSWVDPALTLGVIASKTGQLKFASGVVGGATVTMQNRAGTTAYNLNLPNTAGNSGQVLTSGGGGTFDNAWTNAASGLVSAGTNITITGTTVANINVAAPFNPTTLTNHGVLLGQGSASIAASAVGATGTVLRGATGADPAFGAVNLSTDVTNTLVAGNGGTGNATYTIGDVLQATGSTTLSRLAAVATGNVLRSGGVGAVSAWGKVNQTTDITGVTPIANGGTNASSASGTALDNISGFASTGIMSRTGSGTYTFSTLTALMDSGLCSTRGNIIYRAAGGWSCLTNGGSGTVLSSGGVGADPSWIPSGGTGTVTSATIAGTANNITATGTCTITTSGTCTLDLAAARKTVPTTTELLSGTDVAYSTPANALWLEGWLWGSGGGGGGGGSGAGSGGNGNPTCWKAGAVTACTTPLYQAGAGAAAGASGGSGGAGGTPSGSAACNATGTGAAGAGVGAGGATLPGSLGGPAANRGVPGFGAAPNNNTAPNAPANTGAGGGGGSTSAALIGNGGGGGAWCYFIIAAPGASYVYTIGVGGTGGTAGTSGGAGGNGGSGYGYVIAHYNFLLKRDLEAGNDNTPAFLNAAA